MRRKYLLFFCSFLTVWLGESWIAYGQESSPVVLAVFDVEDKGVGLPAEVCSNLTDYLIALLTGPNFQVVPRQQVKERLLEAKKESFKTCYDQACQIELGRELAAHKVLSTQLIRVGKSCRLVSVLLDLKRATTEKSYAVPSDCSEDNLLDAVEKLVQGLTGQVSSQPPVSDVPAGAEPKTPSGAPQGPAEAAQPTPERGTTARFQQEETTRAAGRPVLGVIVTQLDPQYAERSGLGPDQKGLVIFQVMEDSVAAKVGLKTGDVILSLNGMKIESPPLFSRMVQRQAATGKVNLELWRNGSRQQMEIDLQKATAVTTPLPAPQMQPSSNRQVEETKVESAKPKAKEVPTYHDHLTFHIGPVFENLGSGSSLSGVALDTGTYYADISTGTGFFTEITFDAHIDKIFSFGFGLLYFFNNRLLDEGDRISYLAPTFLCRFSLAFKDWLETRTVLQLGSGVHVGTRLTLCREDNEQICTSITRNGDWEQIFFKASQEMVFYFTEEVGMVLSFGVLLSSGYLDINDAEYSFGLPVILFLSSGIEWR